MSTATAERPMAKQTESVRIDVAVLADARIAAAFTGKQVGEYISDILRPIVQRDIDAGYSKRNRPAKPPKS
jgi:hypothetical protein